MPRFRSLPCFRDVFAPPFAAILIGIFSLGFGIPRGAAEAQDHDSQRHWMLTVVLKV